MSRCFSFPKQSKEKPIIVRSPYVGVLAKCPGRTLHFSRGWTGMSASTTISLLHQQDESKKGSLLNYFYFNACGYIIWPLTVWGSCHPPSLSVPLWSFFPLFFSFCQRNSVYCVLSWGWKCFLLPLTWVKPPALPTINPITLKPNEGFIKRRKKSRWKKVRLKKVTSLNP